MAYEVKNMNATVGTSSVDNDDCLLLQPLWDVVLANSHITASPLFLVFISDGFFFICMIPYIFLDFYALDRWDWVKRYTNEYCSALYFNTIETFYF